MNAVLRMLTNFSETSTREQGNSFAYYKLINEHCSNDQKKLQLASRSTTAYLSTELKYDVPSYPPTT